MEIVNRSNSKMNRNNTQQSQRNSTSMTTNSRASSNQINQSDYIFPLAKITEIQRTVPSTFPQKEESLLKMFNAELFTSDLILEYLYKKYETPGVHEYLVNKLYTIPHHELHFYASFLMNLLISRASPALEGFLSQVSQHNMALYIKLAWSLQAYSECSMLKLTKGWSDRVEKIERVIEMGMVNSPVTPEVLSLATSDKSTPEQQKYVMEMFKDKENRSNYVGTVNRFVNNLIKISLYLKQYTEPQRKLRLKEYIQKLNNFLHQNRVTYEGIHYFQGILIPFSKSPGFSFHSNLVVSIIEDEFLCFNTKKRAPYKVVFETVDIEEMKVRQDEMGSSEKWRKGSFDSKLNSKNINNNNGQEVHNQFDPDNNNNNSNLSDTSFDELEGIKVENAADIDKEIFKDLGQWAQLRKSEELRKLKKGLLEKILSFKKRENVEQYSMQKLDQMVEEARINHEKQKKQQQQQQLSTQSSLSSSRSSLSRYTAAQTQQHMTQNMSSFNAKFPNQRLLRSTSSTLSRYHTTISSKQHTTVLNQHTSKKSTNKQEECCCCCCEEGNNDNNRTHSSYKKQTLQTRQKRSNSNRDMKIKEVIGFFKKLKSKYPQKSNAIDTIYTTLHYDVIEATVLKRNPEQQLKKVELENKPNWPWGQKWTKTQAQLKADSPFKRFASYSLRPFIVKGGDDLRQELLAMNLIVKFNQIFKQSGLPLFLKPYEIIVASESSGFIEFLPNTLSLDALKKKEGKSFVSLRSFYERTFEDQFEKAQQNFVESLAGYSLVCYLLQIKDRHNGNILVDDQGHFIHIDFGFILSMAPGGIKFETAHFKLTKDYVQLMGGLNSEQFSYFKSLLRSTLPCFAQFDMSAFRARFKENFTDKEFVGYVDDLVKGSYDRWSTRQYDKFNMISNGIIP